MNTISLRICQEGHANALALNKDCSQIAVAGRSLLKVFSIENDGFTEVCNMRGGKNQNLSYSSNDVAWSTLDSNILATAATNGVVSVWDLSKFGRQKQLLVYNEHERTAHTVTFHSAEQNILLSGSQDGTIKCFDLRMDKSVNTYFSNSESVRDVKFCPHSSNIFAAVSENGTVQLWDIRRTDKCFLQFTAHSGPIYTCDWHPIKNWLATGSRDKQIKVWNMEGKASLENTIHTIAVVGRVKWRPDRIHHIASCALVVDYSIHIWDVRRPYIPYASFNEHTNITTGIAWKGNDSHVLLSTSKDSTIYKHAFKDALRPTVKANPQGASLNLKNELLFAFKIKTVTPPQVTSNRSSFISNRPKATIPVEQFHLAQSCMYNFTMNPQPNGLNDNESIVLCTDYECFIGCGKEYILKGNDLNEICEINANVSKKYGKHNASLLWKFVRTMYSSPNINSIKTERKISYSEPRDQLTIPSQFNEDINWNEHHVNNPKSKSFKGFIIDDLKLLDFISPKSEELKSCFDIAGTDPIIFEKSQITFDNFKKLRDGFLYVGPHDLTKALSFPEAELNDFQTSRAQENINPECKYDSPLPTDFPSVLKVANITSIPTWDPNLVITECLILQTDVGDVQTSVSILIAMGDMRDKLSLNDIIIESWFHSYVEQLHRFQLWNEATKIIKSSWIRSVQELNQHSTTVHTNCGGCGRPLLGKAGWYCARCKSAESSKCSVCHLVVRGLYAWCQGCSHGGHIEHIKQWFSSRSKCPTCGHLCEYE